MNHRLAISSALASVLALGLAGPSAAQDMDGKGKDKCYGIAKPGQNDCANLSGTHACSGLSKANLDVADWKYVAKGTCKELKGLTEAEAKAKVGAKK